MLIAAYSGLYILISVMVNTYVITPEIISRSWFEASGAARDSFLEAPRSQRDDIIERRGKWQFIGYMLTPLFVMIKIGFTAVCLCIGSALVGWDVPFSDYCRVSTQAECVWAAAAVVHLACVLYIIEVDTLGDYASFYPLSALHLVDLNDDDLWTAYLFKTINLFEMAYAGVLVAASRPLVDKQPARVACLVAVAYGGGLMLLTATVTFVLMSFT